ncbi:hypothetical protein [Gottfriedia acidiceleris]|uniref:Uncharacterized protein n=1 Tax=Gottfriedia acidiceleris TaxID=371036 RepID=A0ABY4JF89_9BACI|nr:hypothetical protein [Gottfriedia acidiceleris]UPM52496.1 hypothetical protein MY490_11635 [Gottfriedia acidiceleris]
MSKSKKNKTIDSNQNNFDELLLEDRKIADDIPIDWLPKSEPITETMSYKNAKD